jgi:23S rRNA pseudouridine2605 synthase
VAEPEGTRPERIAKALSRAGVASRRDAERMIAEGRVSVNGRVIDSPATLVTPADLIAVDGAPLAPPEAPRLWLFHKPAGVVTTARDEKGRQTVFDILPEGMPRVMTVGRLDLTSEGLLLLTNDGGIKRRLELPETGWTRKYRVRVNGRPDDAQLDPLRAGITVDGERFQPMAVTIDRQQGANAWLTVAIREGKNREIRRAMEAVGLTVNRLIRTGYGPFRLGDLAPGAVEEVRPRVLRDQLGLAAPAAAGAATKARTVTTRGRTGRAAAEGAPAAPGGRPAAVPAAPARAARPAPVRAKAGDAPKASASRSGARQTAMAGRKPAPAAPQAGGRPVAAEAAARTGDKPAPRGKRPAATSAPHGPVPEPPAGRKPAPAASTRKPGSAGPSGRRPAAPGATGPKPPRKPTGKPPGKPAGKPTDRGRR